MRIWSGKKVIIIGAARQGIAIGRYLAIKGAQVVMNDQKPATQLDSARENLDQLDRQVAARIEWHFGGHPTSLLEGADCVCVSGGVPLTIPLIQEALRLGILVTNDSQVFLEECPCTTIGITGSAGKTTTTTLVGKIAERAVNSPANEPAKYRKVWVGGNIGTPLISVVDEMQATDLAVVELSSFQLELMTKSTNIACILNITPNHLDRHTSMKEYIAAKKRILDFQTEQDCAILGSDDPGSWALLDDVMGERYFFGRGISAKPIPGAFVDSGTLSLWDGNSVTPVMKQLEIPLRGWHNVENVLAACAISYAAGLPVPAMREAVISFSGVPHRLEWVRTWGGADWYNDSIATAPERVIADLHSFETPDEKELPIVLLAGGRDKNLPWDELAELIHARVDHLILFGEAAKKIGDAVGEQMSGERPFTIDVCAGLEEAVNMAAKRAEPGDIVLLSPGGTSFDEFRDFEERGEAFKRWVSNL